MGTMVFLLPVLQYFIISLSLAGTPMPVGYYNQTIQFFTDKNQQKRHKTNIRPA
jgi:hypothetical protein